MSKRVELDNGKIALQQTGTNNVDLDEYLYYKIRLPQLPIREEAMNKIDFEQLDKTIMTDDFFVDGIEVHELKDYKAYFNPIPEEIEPSKFKIEIVDLGSDSSCSSMSRILRSNLSVADKVWLNLDFEGAIRFALERQLRKWITKHSVTDFWWCTLPAPIINKPTCGCSAECIMQKIIRVKETNTFFTFALYGSHTRKERTLVNFCFQLDMRVCLAIYKQGTKTLYQGDKLFKKRTECICCKSKNITEVHRHQCIECKAEWL